LQAEGWAANVRYLPDPAQSDLLAEIVPTERTAPSARTMRLVQAMRTRRTDRRPVSDEPLPPGTIEALTRAVTGLARLHVLADDQVLELAAAANHAGEIEADDPQIRAELDYWTSRSAADGMGVPPEVLPATPPQTTVPARDFGTPGTLPIGPGHDRYARYALLYGDDDETGSWLRAGAALTSAWLTAGGMGVSVVPLSGAIEVTATRERLRAVLAGVGQPYLVLRLGVAESAHAGPPHTPRLPASQTVDLSQVRV
jgi:hypothetical protein